MDAKEIVDLYNDIYMELKLLSKATGGYISDEEDCKGLAIDLTATEVSARHNENGLKSIADAIRMHS